MGLLSRSRRSPADRGESGLALLEAGALDDASEEFLQAAHGDDPEVTPRAWAAGRRRRGRTVLRVAVRDTYAASAALVLRDHAELTAALSRFELVPPGLVDTAECPDLTDARKAWAYGGVAVVR